MCKTCLFVFRPDMILGFDQICRCRYRFINISSDYLSLMFYCIYLRKQLTWKQTHDTPSTRSKINHVFATRVTQCRAPLSGCSGDDTSQAPRGLQSIRAASKSKWAWRRGANQWTATQLLTIAVYQLMCCDTEIVEGTGEHWRSQRSGSI